MSIATSHNSRVISGGVRDFALSEVAVTHAKLVRLGVQADLLEKPTTSPSNFSTSTWGDPLTAFLQGQRPLFSSIEPH
jgi:hypothetical protein